MSLPAWINDSVIITSDTLEWLAKNFGNCSCSTSMLEEQQELSFYTDYTAECLKNPIMSDLSLSIKHLDEACTDLIERLAINQQPAFSYRVLRMMQHLYRLDEAYTKMFNGMTKEDLQLASEKSQGRHDNKLAS